MFTSQMDLSAGTTVLHTINDQTTAACRGFGKGFPPDSRGSVNVRGLAVSEFGALSQVDAKRRDKAAALWFPLKQLASHQRFSFSANAERSDSCGTTCAEKGEIELHVTARPR